MIPCSIKEPGLYDYVIFNDDLEDAFAQLVLVAKRALSGKQGNGSQSITGPVTLVAEEEPSQASQPAASTAAPANATSAKVSQCQDFHSATQLCVLTEYVSKHLQRTAIMHSAGETSTPSQLPQAVSLSARYSLSQETPLAVAYS